MIVEIERLDDFGRGIAYVDGKIVFVSNALPGEVVKIEIIKENKKYLEARVEEYISKVPSRTSGCKYFGICGGCSLSHMSFQDENKFKENKVRNIMSKFAGIDASLVKDIVYDEPGNYRNKVVLHGKDGVLGLYKESSKEIVSIDRCLLLNEKINNFIEVLRDVNKNILEVTIKASNDCSSLLVSIDGEVKDISKLLEVCDVLILNNKCLTSDKRILTNIGNKKYYQSVNSFFQVNMTLTEKLYNKVYESLKDIHPNKLLDLYCGCGTIGIYLSDICHEIIGIDYNKFNIDDANINASLNGVSNIKFICDKVENRIDSFNGIDAIVVDPPRAGLDSKTREYLLKISADTIVYVSCDPVTLARDLKTLSSKYNVLSITPFNMFPRTYHVECCLLLCLKDTSETFDK